MTTTYIGTRCRVVTSIRDYQTGAYMRGWTGVIRSQSESCGHLVCLVSWDHTHAPSYVFPDDIELLDEPPAGTPLLYSPCQY